VHHKSIIYNKPTRCNSGSIVFINNYKYALHSAPDDGRKERNMYSILVVVNKHNTARVASCCFIIYYSVVTLTYTVWHVDTYKITFKLVINWTNEIL